MTSNFRPGNSPANTGKDGVVQPVLLWGQQQTTIRGGGITLGRGKTIGGGLGPCGHRHREQIHQNFSGGRGVTYGGGTGATTRTREQ